MTNSRKLIVVVDDDRTNLADARSALMDAYDIFTVSSGAKLFALLDKSKPDLILLDIKMPEMDGYDVIRILKSTAHTAEIPVIFLSALQDAESEVTGLDLGAVDYIFKPISKKILLKHVELHLLIDDRTRELTRRVGELEDALAQKDGTIAELRNAAARTGADSAGG